MSEPWQPQVGEEVAIDLVRAFGVREVYLAVIARRTRTQAVTRGGHRFRLSASEWNRGEWVGLGEQRGVLRPVDDGLRQAARETQERIQAQREEEASEAACRALRRRLVVFLRSGPDRTLDQLRAAAQALGLEDE